MHSVAKCLFNSGSWISARLAQECISGFGYKSNLSNMAMVFLANVSVHSKGDLFKGIISQQNACDLCVKIKYLVSSS